MSSLSEQTEAVGILRELARAIWAKWNDGAECPANRIPTPECLAAWLKYNPMPMGDDAVVAVVRHVHGLDDTVPILTEWMTARHFKEPDSVGFVVARWMHPVDYEGRCILAEANSGIDALGLAYERKVELRGESASVEALHRYWKTTCQAGKNVRHPLANLEAAWLQPPTEFGIEIRQHQNIPRSLTRTPQVVVAPGNGGQPHPSSDRDVQPDSIAPPPERARFEVGYLPSIEGASRLPIPLLDLLDCGASRGRNGPVPISTRMGLELILLPESHAVQAEQATVTLTNATMGKRVWPNTKRYQPEKHGPILYAGARRLSDPDSAYLVATQRGGTQDPGGDILCSTVRAVPPRRQDRGVCAPVGRRA